MIAFATSITNPEQYQQCAEPGIRLAAEPDSEVYAFTSIGTIFRSYNALLDHASTREDLEALVLLHQDTEIVDGDFCRAVRDAVRDPTVGVVGCVGAVDVRSIAWWEGSVALASFVHRYDELGGGDLPAFSWAWSEAPPYARTGEVDTLDGFLMVLSPWVVRNIRFDESLGQLHGYDFDFCLQVRAAGRKVVTADFRAIHSRSISPFHDPEEWIAAHIKIAEKWDGKVPGVGSGIGTWQERTRRAEAERDAARITEYANLLDLEARTRRIEAELRGVRESTSWRVTAPLRGLSRGASLRRRNGGRRARLPGLVRR